MKLIASVLLAVTVLFAPDASAAEKKAKAGKNPVVVMKTSMGVITLELNQQKAPETVANFLRYVDEKFYNGTIFHRVMSDFMIQGGGHTADLKPKITHEQIKNESLNGLKNDRGTIAMARMTEPNSATSQFFINVVDNAMLNGGKDFGYTVFGKVISGMDVVDRIKIVPVGTKERMQNVPRTPVVIESIQRK